MGHYSFSVMNGARVARADTKNYLSVDFQINSFDRRRVECAGNHQRALASMTMTAASDCGEFR